MPPRVAFSHVGIFVEDAGRMARFYGELLGLVATDRGRLGEAELVFLSGDAREHHQLVLVSGRPHKPGFNVVNQLSFRVADLEALRWFAREAPARGATDLQPVTHGNAVSLYLRDPEGNRVELFIDTPWHVEQPLRVPIDLAQPDATLWREIEALCRRQPGFRPAAEWRAALARRLAR